MCHPPPGQGCLNDGEVKTRGCHSLSSRTPGTASDGRCRHYPREEEGGRRRTLMLVCSERKRSKCHSPTWPLATAGFQASFPGIEPTNPPSAALEERGGTYRRVQSSVGAESPGEQVLLVRILSLSACGGREQGHCAYYAYRLVTSPAGHVPRTGSPQHRDVEHVESGPRLVSVKDSSTCPLVHLSTCKSIHFRRLN